MSRKPIIVFEGIEASGKSHHISVVANYLKNKKISFIKLREPGGSRNSEKIRRIILNKKTKFKKETDLFLYLASRSENIDLINKYYNKHGGKKQIPIIIYISYGIKKSVELMLDYSNKNNNRRILSPQQLSSLHNV